MTLDEIFDDNKIVRCKLLKIDCEGAEYEILPNARALSRVDYLSGEFHMNGPLRERGCSVDALIERVAAVVPRERLAVKANLIND